MNCPHLLGSIGLDGVDGEGADVAALVLAQRLTGVTIEREWLLGQPRPTWTATGFSNSD
jgi:hypothetical protein